HPSSSSSSLLQDERYLRVFNSIKTSENNLAHVVDIGNDYNLNTNNIDLPINDDIDNNRINGAPQEPKVPKLEKSTKAFYNHKCMPNPYRIFWDLECLTTKLTPEEKAQLTRTEKIQRHMPCGYSYAVVRMDTSRIRADLSALAEMVMEPGDYTRHRMATECWICKKDFSACKEKDMVNIELSKVRDHFHISGKYRGPAHSDCSKKLQMGAFKTKVPLICHNFRGYDSHLLIEVVCRFTSDRPRSIYVSREGNSWGHVY
ncbi:14522_t:CDS:2, partial [Entrophospora sp. SA101]